MIMKTTIELTKKGYPSIWEKGGGMSNTGSATIVAGSHGEKLPPVWINRRGELSCGYHALIIISEGYHVIFADQHRGDYEIQVCRITAIDKEFQLADLELVCEYSHGEWDVEPSYLLSEAIDSAVKKANCYHCREPHFVKEP